MPAFPNLPAICFHIVEHVKIMKGIVLIHGNIDRGQTWPLDKLYKPRVVFVNGIPFASLNAELTDDSEGECWIA